MTGQLLRLLPSVLDLLDKCERCSLPGRDVYHGDRQPRERHVCCQWFGCRSMTLRTDAFCSDNHRDMAAAQEERVRQMRAVARG